MIDGTKSRVLWLERYLFANTDKDHPVTTPQIIALVEERFGSSVNRTTLPNDFALLDSQGFHCEVIRSKQNTYYYEDRLFSDMELQELMDTVMTAPFLPEQERARLTEKLRKLTSVYKAANLEVIPTTGSSSSAHSIRQTISEAILSHRQVSLEKTPPRKRGKKKKETIVLSPFQIFWDEGAFTVIGEDADTQETVAVRLDDGICHAEMLPNKPAAQTPKRLEIWPYTHGFFYAPGVQAETVTLHCKEHVLHALKDRFGRHAKYEKQPDKTYMVTVLLSPSQAFFNWVFANTGNVTIVGPDPVRERLKELTEQFSSI